MPDREQHLADLRAAHLRAAWTYNDTEAHRLALEIQRAELTPSDEPVNR